MQLLDCCCLVCPHHQDCSSPSPPSWWRCLSSRAMVNLMRSAAAMAMIWGGQKKGWGWGYDLGHPWRRTLPDTHLILHGRARMEPRPPGRVGAAASFRATGVRSNTRVHEGRERRRQKEKEKERNKRKNIIALHVGLSCWGRLLVICRSFSPNIPKKQYW